MYRLESDSFGDIPVSTEVYYGANTARSLQNFAIGAERERMPVRHCRYLGEGLSWGYLSMKDTGHFIKTRLQYT